MTPEPAVADEIRSFVRDNWTLIKGRVPGFAAHSEAFEAGFESMQGRFTDDQVTARIDFLVVAGWRPMSVSQPAYSTTTSSPGRRRVGSSQCLSSVQAAR